MKEATLKAKQAVVSDIVDKLNRSQTVVFYDYRGLSVAQVTDLRNKLREAGVEYRVLKNTMVSRAAKEVGITGLDEVLNGPSALAFGYDDPAAPAKILSDFAKAAKISEIKGGIFEKQAISLDRVKALAALPSKEQLLTQVAIGLNGVTSKFVRTLAALRDKLEEQSA